MWECRASARHGVWKLHDLSPLASFSQHLNDGNAMQVIADGANINHLNSMTKHHVVM
jgi:hypothetical protein